MQKDNLFELVEQILNQCKKENIAVFHGDIVENKCTEVSWDVNESSNWNEYLQVLKYAGIKMLTITTEKNDFDPDELDEYINDLSGNKLAEFKAANSVVKQRLGHIVCFTLTFFQGAVSYSFYKEAEWYHEYTMLQNAIEDSEVEIEVLEKLSDQEIERRARKIIENPEFAGFKDRFGKRLWITTILQNEGIENELEIFKILQKAENIYESEILPKLEQELAQKIKELKEQGLKKIEIRGKLKISEGTLNKHWY